MKILGIYPSSPEKQQERIVDIQCEKCGNISAVIAQNETTVLEYTSKAKCKKCEMKNNNNHIFNIDLEKLNIQKAPKYYISIDISTDDQDSSYCLVHKIGEEKNVLLLKNIKNRTQFKEEVNNLAKYFNAQVIEQKYGK